MRLRGSGVRRRRDRLRGRRFQCLLASLGVATTDGCHETQIQADWYRWAPMYGDAVSAPKNLKKCLAMAAGIVRTAVTLRALGGFMRKFKRSPWRRLRFRSLLILTV